MKRETLFSRFRLTIALLCAAVILLWLVFYLAMRRSIEASALDTVEQVSQTVIASLETTFLNMKNMSYAMAHDPAFLKMLKAEDTIEFYDASTAAFKQVGSITSVDRSVSNIILYNNTGRFYQFKGGMSNTILNSIFKSVSESALPQNISCTGRISVTLASSLANRTPSLLE